MVSFILYFKHYVYAIIIVLIIESSLTFIPLPEINWRGDLIDTSFRAPPILQKFITEGKRNIFLGKDYDIIQIGDSSGFFGVQPKIINEYLSGKKYLSTNCCADLGWQGYSYVAEDYLSQNPKAKHLILYFSPYSLPMVYKQGFSEEYKKSYLSIGEFLNNKMPSFSLRVPVTNLLFYHKWSFDFYKDPSSGWLNIPPFKEWLMKFKESDGWAPFPLPNTDVPIGKCDKQLTEGLFDSNGRPTLYDNLVPIKNVADKFNVKLLVITNPVACEQSDEIKPFIDELNKFKNHYPDVIFYEPFITTVPKENMGDRWHLTSKASINNSHRIGKFLKKYFELNIIK
ncbi:MAG: hypothetical protein J0H68_05875 [Sphingobacteriia bacterium]|nr:hypothetical protein [Sphingobacteriia bacterium]